MQICTFFPRAPFPGGNASGCRPHPGKRSHHPLPSCPVTNHLARLGFFVHQKPVESAGQNRATFIPTVHQRNSIDSTSLPAGTVQTGRTFRILQVRGGQFSRTYRFHTSARPAHHQHEIRGRRGKSPSPSRVDGRLSLFRRAGFALEGRPRCRRHFVDSRQSTRHFPLVAQSRFSRLFLLFLPGKLMKFAH